MKVVVEFGDEQYTVVGYVWSGKTVFAVCIKPDGSFTWLPADALRVVAMTWLA